MNADKIIDIIYNDFMSIINILQQLGFSKNEVDVYLASLEIGVASVQEIAKKANIKRTTAYSVLDTLVQRGYIGKTKVQRKTRFMAEPPDKLLFIVSNIHSQLTKSLPELKAIYNLKQIKPKITFFEGKGAIQNVYDDTLREKPKEILEWNTDRYFKYFPKEYNYIQKRTQLNIRARRMAPSNSIWHRKHKSLDKMELAETVIVPFPLFSPEIEVNIYNNKVAFINYVEKISVIIESPAIAKAMKQAYEISWIGAKSIEVR